MYSHIPNQGKYKDINVPKSYITSFWEIALGQKDISKEFNCNKKYHPFDPHHFLIFPALTPNCQLKD